MDMKPANLPRIGEYLTSVAPDEISQELWAWINAVPARERRKARVLDLRFPPGPDGFVGD